MPRGFQICRQIKADKTKKKQPPQNFQVNIIIFIEAAHKRFTVSGLIRNMQILQIPNE